MIVTLTSKSELSAFVLRERKLNKITKTGLAREAGLSRQEIADVESGRCKHLRFDTLRKIASALGYDLAYTLTSK